MIEGVIYISFWLFCLIYVSKHLCLRSKQTNKILNVSFKISLLKIINAYHKFTKSDISKNL